MTHVPLATQTVQKTKTLSTSLLPLAQTISSYYSMKKTKETLLTYLMSMSFFCCWASILVKVSLWILHAALPYFDSNSRFSILKNNKKKIRNDKFQITGLVPGFNRMWTNYLKTWLGTCYYNIKPEAAF